MRTTLKESGSNLASYLYQQYEDDEDLRAFVGAQNSAAQIYLDWFNGVALPYYPALSDDLLNWVIKGLYGLNRTQLASPKTPALGMLNTVELNTFQLDQFTPSAQTFYNIDDDLFKRILTWDYYKGDGRRFSTRWLKRRVMRFLTGADGLDPQPYRIDDTGAVVLNPDFSVGAETTTAVGVLIDPATNVCQVTIDQSLISLQTNLKPNVLQLFKLAFEGRALELPLTYTYAVNIIVNFIAVAHPGAVSSSGPAANQTTPSTTVAVLGGSGIYTYLWAWQVPGLLGAAVARATAAGSLTAGARSLSGVAIVNTTTSASLATSAGGTLSIDSPTAATTTFTATGLAYGQTLSGVAVCTVTDTVSGKTTTATVLVTVTRVAPDNIDAEDGPAFVTEDGAFIFVEA